MNRTPALALAAVALLLAACGGGSSTTGPKTDPITWTASPSAAPLTSAALAERAGCARPTDTPDLPLFIAQGSDCLDPAWTTKQDPSIGDFHVSFYVFNNNDGRDAWLQQAATFGDHGVIKGDRWAVEIPDDLPNLHTVASTIATRLNGERVL